jgi:hypothetical protein
MYSHVLLDDRDMVPAWIGGVLIIRPSQIVLTETRMASSLDNAFSWDMSIHRVLHSTVDENVIICDMPA